MASGIAGSMKLDAFLVCEDVRLEMQGQLTLVGVFGHVLSVPILPLVFPKLGVFVRLTGVAPGKHAFTVTIRDETLATDVVSARGEHNQGTQPDPQLATFRVQFGAVRVTSWGLFNVIFGLDESATFTRPLTLRPPSWDMIYVRCGSCDSLVPSGIAAPPEAAVHVSHSEVRCANCGRMTALDDDIAIHVHPPSYTIGSTQAAK
jgi:hypothetical protein